MTDDKILLAHGSGGRLQNELIKKVILRYFRSPVLKKLEDSAVLENGKIAFTTDSFVVKPVFFPGGDIGKLSICGTVNDLLCSGAMPKYIGISLIIEEGFPFEKLGQILKSARDEAEKNNVEITCGDTKVVERGKCDEIFITTSGIGILKKKPLSVKNIKIGDKIIINGTIGDHGISVLSEREGVDFKTTLISDCASLTGLVESMLVAGGVRYFRDPTRGGLGVALAEIANESGFGIEIEEDKIPVTEQVRGACDLLGLDPLYVANEGKMIAFVDKTYADKALNAMKKDKLGKGARIIGEIVSAHKKVSLMITKIGGKRIIDLPRGELLPRIC